MPTKKDIVKVLRTVIDPELHMDIWNLGLIYEVSVKKDTVEIVMTFTTPLCPYGPMLLEMIEDAVKDEYKSVKKVKIDVTFDPPWTPSDELRAMFGV